MVKTQLCFNSLRIVIPGKHNRPMEYFDKLLTLGQHLSSERQFELYEFLRKENYENYLEMLRLIKRDKVAFRKIANAEIKYELRNGFIKDYIREANGEFWEGYRSIRVLPFEKLNRKKFINFFAQCDVDAIANFPVPSEVERTYFGFGVLAYPFYSLEFYSRGRGKALGLLKRKNRIAEMQSYVAKMNNLGLY